MKYTEKQLKFFRECGKKSWQGIIEKNGEEKAREMRQENARKMNEKRKLIIK